MDADQALADLTEFSTQIEGAVLAGASGNVLASTFAGAEKAESVSRAGLRLLEAAAETRRDAEGADLVQLEAATPEGSVFVVRDARHVIAAVTAPEPTAGLIFYDLKTCLRLVGEEEKSAARGEKESGQGAKEQSGRKKEAAGAEGGGDA